MRLSHVLARGFTLALLAACGPNASATLPATDLSNPGAVKFALIDRFGPPFYCGPPVVRENEADLALPQIQSDVTTYNAILAHEHLTPPLDAGSKQVVYNDWMELKAVTLQQNSDGTYSFTLATQSLVYQGTVDAQGRVNYTTQGTQRVGGCPVN